MFFCCFNFKFIIHVYKQNKLFLLEKIYSYNFWFILMWVYHDFFCYQDPDQRFLKWIRIRPNDTDPTGSGSETLIKRILLLQARPRRATSAAVDDSEESGIGKKKRKILEINRFLIPPGGIYLFKTGLNLF